MTDQVPGGSLALVMSLEPGMMVGNNVRLVRMLGRGGMGSVWVADHLTLHTQVAVKFMAAEIAENAEAFARFSREAAAAAQIKSPHVVQTFDHGRTADGIPYIVMELLEGEDLSQRVARAGALPPEVAVNVIGQVCKALGRAHSLGIVHRDIKPENIFLTETDGDLLVKVLDFGIAKRAQDAALSMTSTGAMVGTPYYMSPEQVMSAKSVDFRSDLWSVAVVVYHALTGKVPFDAETMGALCVTINSAEFQAPSLRRPGLTPSVDAWFRKALARDPSQRFQSAKELATTLQQALTGVAASTSGTMPSPMSSTYSGGVAAHSVAEPGPMLPAAAGTLAAASVTSSQQRRVSGLVLALLAGGGALVVLLLAVGALVLRNKGSAEAAPAAQIEAVPSPGASSAPAATPAPEPPPAPPAPAAPEPSATPKVEPVAKPAEPKAERPKASTKATPTAKETAPPPATTTKPKDKYGF